MRPKRLLPALLLVIAACGTDVAGPSASLFSCLLTAPVVLDVGEVVQVSGAANRGLCLDGGAGGVELVYIPFHAASPDAAVLPLDVSGAGVVPVVGPPSPSPVGGEPVALRGGAPVPSMTRDAAFHAALRDRELRELGPRIRRAARTRASRVADASSESSLAASKAVRDVPAVGDLIDYNVAISCTVADIRTGRVEYVADRAVVVADIQNPAGLTAADFQHFGETFDTLVDPVGVQHFGEPTDIDENGRAIIFFTRAVNEMAAPSAGVVTLGFFWSGDLFPEQETERAQACPAANQAEMFYMLTADPSGLAGPAFTAEFIRRNAIAIIAHEYQHLINASRRLWINDADDFEAVWLNEGLSHVAEEVTFYAASGLAAGTNIGYADLQAAGAIDAFNAYMGGNFSNYAAYLEDPDTASVMGIDVLSTRGAAWSFLRYAADRSGRTDAAFLTDVVNAQAAGLDNLRDVLGADPLAWMRDWTVSVYADDALAMEPRFIQPSWNFRDLYPNSSIGAFPLQVILLEPGAVARIRLQPGGAAYPRFGLEAGGTAVVHVEAGGGAPPAALRGSFLRTQ